MSDIPGFVRCDECKGWHHPDYHSKEPFNWGRRVRAIVAWRSIKRAAYMWWKVLWG
jgi:hypothetical protein